MPLVLSEQLKVTVASELFHPAASGAGVTTALMVGTGAFTTLMVTSPLPAGWESFAVRRRTYVPTWPNAAVVAAAAAAARLTVTGPLTLLQESASVWPSGSMSSLTFALKEAAAGIVIVCSAPASTAGRWFAPSSGPNLRRYSSELRNALTISARTKLPLN
jgi:hypothetical protein